MKTSLVALSAVAFSLLGGYLVGYHSDGRDRDILWQQMPIYVDEHGRAWHGKSTPYVVDISVNIRENRMPVVSASK